MIDKSNPASRLHTILVEAARHSDKQTVKVVWSSVIGCENDNISVTRAVVELYSLSQEIQSLIRIIDGLNHNLFLSSFNKLEQSFFPLNLDAPWQVSKQYLTEGVLTKLEFCAEELTKFYSEESLTNNDLEDIITKTDDLYDSLYKSKLPNTIRLVLLEEVERIRLSIKMYKIKGAKGLKQALQCTIGAFVANKDELKEISGTSDVLVRLGQLIDKLDLFTSRALKLKRVLTTPIAFFINKIDNANEEVAEFENKQNNT